MMDIGSLCIRYTDLDCEDIKKLESISQVLPYIAELVEADVFIDCLTGDEDAAIVVAEAKPAARHSMYSCSVLGELAYKENEPAAIRTLKIGMPTRDLKAVTQENRTVRQDVIPVKNKAGRVIAALIIEKDITEDINQNRQIEMLTETTEQLTGTILDLTSNDSMIANYSNDAVIMFDSGGMVRYRNSVAEGLFNKLGYKDDIIGMDFENVTLSGKTFEEVIMGEKLSTVDMIIGKMELQVKYIVPDNKDNLVRLIVIIKDITEVKKKEKELILKSVAMREIHHRVKNNLQTIASLLRLQMRRVDNDAAKMALNESISRILSIAFTHEILAKSGMDDVDIKMVLCKIKDSVIRYFSMPDKDIQINVTGDSIIINSEIATSIGLVVNELLQNSLEHAFCERDRGKVEVCIQKGKVYSSISVTDNGTGFDESIIGSDSLGISIIKSIVKDKINGNMNIESTPDGTKVMFDFKNQ